MLDYLLGKEEESSTDESMEERLNSESSADESSEYSDDDVSMKKVTNDKKRKRETDSDDDREDKRERNNDYVSVEEELSIPMTAPYNDQDAIQRFGLPAIEHIFSRQKIAAENATRSDSIAAEQNHFKDVATNWMWGLYHEGEALAAKQEASKNHDLALAHRYVELLGGYRSALIAEGAQKWSQLSSQASVVAPIENPFKRKLETPKSDDSLPFKKPKKDDTKKRKERESGKLEGKEEEVTRIKKTKKG